MIFIYHSVLNTAVTSAPVRKVSIMPTAILMIIGFIIMFLVNVPELQVIRAMSLSYYSNVARRNPNPSTICLRWPPSARHPIHHSAVYYDCLLWPLLQPQEYLIHGPLIKSNSYIHLTPIFSEFMEESLAKEIQSNDSKSKFVATVSHGKSQELRIVSLSFLIGICL